MASSSKGLVGCGIMAAVQAGELQKGRERWRKLGAKLLLFKQLSASFWETRTNHEEIIQGL